jgi:hypothetical protein
MLITTRVTKSTKSVGEDSALCIKYLENVIKKNSL